MCSLRCLPPRLRVRRRPFTSTGHPSGIEFIVKVVSGPPLSCVHARHATTPTTFACGFTPHSDHPLPAARFGGLLQVPVAVGNRFAPALGAPVHRPPTRRLTLTCATCTGWPCWSDGALKRRPRCPAPSWWAASRLPTARSASACLHPQRSNHASEPLVGRQCTRAFVRLPIHPRLHPHQHPHPHPPCRRNQRFPLRRHHQHHRKGSDRVARLRVLGSEPARASSSARWRWIA